MLSVLSWIGYKWGAQSLSIYFIRLLFLSPPIACMNWLDCQAKKNIEVRKTSYRKRGSIAKVRTALKMSSALRTGQCGLISSKASWLYVCAKNFIIQLNSLWWSLITHNSELAWRKHGGHCVIYFMFVRDTFFPARNPVVFSVVCLSLVGVCLFCCGFSLSLSLSIFHICSTHRKARLIFPVLWPFFLHHPFMCANGTRDSFSTYHIEDDREKKGKHKKSFIIVIWGAVMYQYRCRIAKNRTEHNSCWF